MVVMAGEPTSHSGWDSSLATGLAVIVDWFRSHILQMDRKLTDFLKAEGLT
jgi:hemerythrin